MPRIRTRRLAALGLVAALLGPTAALSAQPPGDEQPTPAPSATISFSNHSTEQAIVWAIGTSGERWRIGTVMPGRTERLRVPAGLLASSGTVQFVARPLASRDALATGLVSLRAGESLSVTLPAARNTLVVLPGRS